jgi:hypothetical protein
MEIAGKAIYLFTPLAVMSGCRVYEPHLLDTSQNVGTWEAKGPDRDAAFLPAPRTAPRMTAAERTFHSAGGAPPTEHDAGGDRDGAVARATRAIMNSDAARSSDTTVSADDDASAAQGTAGATAMPPVAAVSAACRGRVGYVSSESGHCYLVVEQPATWYVARDMCGEIQAHLASVTSAQEQRFIASFDRPETVWIGLSNFGSNYFSWITSENYAFSAWAVDAPATLAESGVIMLADAALWSNRPPDQRHASLCELE